MILNFVLSKNTTKENVKWLLIGSCIYFKESGETSSGLQKQIEHGFGVARNDREITRHIQFDFFVMYRCMKL